MPMVRYKFRRKSLILIQLIAETYHPLPNTFFPYAHYIRTKERQTRKRHIKKRHANSKMRSQRFASFWLSPRQIF